MVADPRARRGVRYSAHAILAAALAAVVAGVRSLTAIGQWVAEAPTAVLTDQPAMQAPGTGFEYSNTNYLLAGQLVEKVTGSRCRGDSPDHRPAAAARHLLAALSDRQCHSWSAPTRLLRIRRGPCRYHRYRSQWRPARWRDDLHRPRSESFLHRPVVGHGRSAGSTRTDAALGRRPGLACPGGIRCVRPRHRVRCPDLGSRRQHQFPAESSPDIDDIVQSLVDETMRP